MIGLVLPRWFLLMLAALLVAGTIGYGLFEARRLITGPQLTIESPLDGSATSSTAVLISGRAENIAFLTINDKPALTDEAGNFSQLLTPAPGYAIFTVAATDRFGRRVTKDIRITKLNYCPINTA